MASLHVIFGNGPVGASVARSLLQKGHTVRMVSRTARRPRIVFDELSRAEQDRLELRSADALDPQAVLAAGRGATHIYHCVNVAYQDWQRVLPGLQANIVAAAVKEKAVFAMAENLYMYARGVPVINDDTAEVPPTRKGLLRKQLHERLVETAKATGLAWTTVRASDYYGPGATFQSLFGTQLFLDPLFKGKRPRVVGSLDQPHTYTYVEDYGRALAVAALDPRAYGRSWIVPNDRTLTARQTSAIFFSASGKKQTLGVIPRPVIAGLGLFNPLLRELVEMLYQKEEPYVVDGSQFARQFAFTPTTLEEGVRRTIEWYRRAQAAA